MGHPADAFRNAWASRLLRTYAILWACYLLAAILITRSRVLPRWTLLWIITIATLVHILIYVNPMPMSTDSYRYVWDGHLLVHGVNPYRYAPDAPELKHLPRRKLYADGIPLRPHPVPARRRGAFRAAGQARETDRVAFFWTFMACNLGLSLLLIPSCTRRAGTRKR